MTELMDPGTVTTFTVTPATRSSSIAALAAALAAAQGAMRGAPKSSENPYFKSKYADLASVWDAIREPLAANKLAVVQLTHEGNGSPGIVVETILMHASGEWIAGRLRLKPVKDDPQGVGSCITYARRYGLQAIVGIAAEDDDGNAASIGGPSATQRATPAPPPADPAKPRRGRPRASDAKGTPETAQVDPDAARGNGGPPAGKSSARKELVALVTDWHCIQHDGAPPISNEVLGQWCKGVLEAAGCKQDAAGAWPEPEIARAVEWALPRMKAGEKMPPAVG